MPAFAQHVLLNALLPVRGQPLLAWHVQALLAGGFDRLVFNTAWLADEISSFFGTQRFSVLAL